MAYWLSNTSTLLFLLQRSLKAANASGTTPNRKPSSATSLFGRMTMVLKFSIHFLWHLMLSVLYMFVSSKCILGQFQGFRSSSSSSNLAASLSVVRQVEAKYPALLFKQQLAAFVEKIYGIIRDNLKKELSSLLSLCIQVYCTSLCYLVEVELLVFQPQLFMKISATLCLMSTLGTQNI